MIRWRFTFPTFQNLLLVEAWAFCRHSEIMVSAISPSSFYNSCNTFWNISSVYYFGNWNLCCLNFIFARIHFLYRIEFIIMVIIVILIVFQWIDQMILGVRNDSAHPFDQRTKFSQPIRTTSVAHSIIISLTKKCCSCFCSSTDAECFKQTLVLALGLRIPATKYMNNYSWLRLSIPMMWRFDRISVNSINVIRKQINR